MAEVVEEAGQAHRVHAAGTIGVVAFMPPVLTVVGAVGDIAFHHVGDVAVGFFASILPNPMVPVCMPEAPWMRVILQWTKAL